MSETATAVRVVIPGCPDAGLSPNARSRSWHKKARLVREARETARLLAWAQTQHDGYPLFDGPVTVRCTIGWAKGRKAVDADNALAMLKSSIDGCNGILWADDRLCRFEPVQQERDPEGRGFVELVVTQ